MLKDRLRGIKFWELILVIGDVDDTSPYCKERNRLCLGLPAEKWMG